MRIGLVLSSTPGYSETFFRSKIKGLIANGHEVILFTGRKESDFDLCPVICSPKVHPSLSVRVISVFMKLLYLFGTKPLTVYRFYKAEKSSGITLKQTVENMYINSHVLQQQLHWLHFGFATLSLRRENVARAIGAKMGVSLRGYDISLYPLKFPGSYKLLWNRVDKVHVISDDLYKIAIRHGLKPETPFAKITPAINALYFKRNSDFHNLGSPLQILTVARLKWKKGLEYTLEALSKIKEAGVTFHYTIIGEGEELPRLVFAAKQLNIFEHITFAGKKSHDEVKNEMEHASLYLQYSLQEGFSNAVLEAQAMGLLCVVSDAEGLSENVINNQTGWVVPRRRPKLLAEKIVEIAGTSISELNQVRNNAISRVQNEFNLENQQASFNDFFTHVPLIK